jgi:uncharacterized phage-associated protein
MPYPAAAIANEFIRRGRTENIGVDPLKIQKLVYLAHGWHLAFLGMPLIREHIEAWKYGPVVPVLYRAFRRFGFSSIDTEMKVPDDSPPLDERTCALLGEVWKTYRHKSGVELSMLTHETGYAWDLTRHMNEDGWSSPVIDNSLIRDEFRKRQLKG